VLEAFAQSAPAGVLLVLVPRHPQRFDEVAAMVKSCGLSLQRRSGNDAVQASTRVWLGDSLGEMFAFYHAADCALIGGSLLPYGGQNLIEACAVGCPVMLGRIPRTLNRRRKTPSHRVPPCGGSCRIVDRRSERLMHDGAARQQMSEAGKAFTAAHKGATGRVWELLSGGAAR